VTPGGRSHGDVVGGGEGCGASAAAAAPLPPSQQHPVEGVAVTVLEVLSRREGARPVRPAEKKNRYQADNIVGKEGDTHTGLVGAALL